MMTPTLQQHQLERQEDGRLYCPVCRWSWSRGPLAKCPGVPRYYWNTRPENLRTQTELRRAGRNPGGPPLGAVAAHDFGWYWLYDLEASVPRRPLTTKQIEALARRKAERERRIEEARLAAIRAEQEAMDRAHRRARDWARETLAAGTALLLDLEATDFDGRPVQIAILALDGTVLLDTLCNPERPISPGATSVHGLTDADVAGAPTFPELYPRLADLLGERVVITYNVAFDARILDLACWAYDLPPLPVASWDCAMEAYAEWYGDWNERHQSYTWQSLPGGDHTALGDCQATRRLLQRMAESAAEVPDVAR